jgi:hypothetical protein
VFGCGYAALCPEKNHKDLLMFPQSLRRFFVNVRPEVVEVLRQWGLKAEHDLEAANRIMAIETAILFI